MKDKFRLGEEQAEEDIHISHTDTSFLSLKDAVSVRSKKKETKH